MNTRWTALLALALAPATLGADLQISEAWVRALPPTQSNTAAYLTAVNQGDNTVVVSGATAELAGRAELHNSLMVDGYMRMQPLPSVTLAPGETLTLAPGGKHLMLLDLERMPASGETVQLCLTTDQGEPVCTEAPVRRGDGADQHNHKHH
ncbi:MAG: copper chaperone PCu(A)C [Halieaceae bacterium]